MSMINIGFSGVQAAQLALVTASNNVANLMTPGYSRRAVLMTSVATGGVTTPAILRFNDTYKTHQLWASSATLGQHNAIQSYFDQLEGVMAPGDGVGNDLGLGDFFNALNEASTDPASRPLRQAVLSAADALAKRFNNMSTVLSNQLRGVEQQRETTVIQVNSLAQTIADLNKHIAAAQASGADVATLLDQRDSALDKLSGLAGVRVLEQDNGTVDVSLPGGQPIVVGDQAATMSVQRDATGQQVLSIRFGKQDFSVPEGGVGGELRGLETFETGTLRPQMDGLKALAQELATQINGQLTNGFDMNGAAGKPLFAFDPATGKLSIDDTLTPDDLAFSSDPDSPGDSGNLLALIALKDRKFTLPGFGIVSFDESLPTMIAKLGTESRQNKASLDTSQAVRTQAENAWYSVGGVDQDEEAVNLLQFQQMYQANMKVISVANTLFETVINSI